jgi:RNA polymerase sigma factor (TIGR02999 family)
MNDVNATSPTGALGVGSAADAVPAAGVVGFDTLYRRLRAICRQRLSRERVDHTLQATALANEVFLKLLSRDEGKARNPAGATRWFIANAVVAIREVLVDHARGRGRAKRGGGRVREALDEEVGKFGVPPLDPDVAARIQAVDALLSELATVSTVQAEIVALRFFAGLTFAQIAEQLEMSETTVRREWVLARVWMGNSPAAAGWGE